MSPPTHAASFSNVNRAETTAINRKAPAFALDGYALLRLRQTADSRNDHLHEFLASRERSHRQLMSSQF